MAVSVDRFVLAKGLISGWSQSHCINRFDTCFRLGDNSCFNCGAGYKSCGNRRSVASIGRGGKNYPAWVSMNDLIDFNLWMTSCPIKNSLSLNLTTRTTLWNITVNTFLVWVAHVAFSQNNIQRIASLPSLQAARRFVWNRQSPCLWNRSIIRSVLYFRAVVILFVAVAVMLFINCGIGLIMYAYYYDCDPVQAHKMPNYDRLLPNFVQSVAGHIEGMSGLFVACLFCASLSIVAPILHSLSGILYKDCIRPLNLFPDNDANANRAMRLIIFAVGTYCAFSSALVEEFQSAFQVLNAVTSMTTGAKVGVFTMGLFWPWTNINVNSTEFSEQNLDYLEILFNSENESIRFFCSIRMFHVFFCSRVFSLELCSVCASCARLLWTLSITRRLANCGIPQFQRQLKDVPEISASFEHCKS